MDIPNKIVKFAQVHDFSSNGEAIYQSMAPDTITSWVASAFAINDNSGLGVAPTTSKVRLFTWLSLNCYAAAILLEKYNTPVAAEL